jgi:hypothetical protein
VVPDTNHAVFMPEKHGLEVTIWVGFGGIKVILAIKVVKLACRNGSQTFLVDNAQIKPD